MSDRAEALTTVKGGINRQRSKGAALKDSLYDLLNGYVTKSRTVVVRPGTFRHAELSEDTAVVSYGLASFNDSLHVFAASLIDVPDGFELHVVTHPTDATQALAAIHVAAPFMGFLYVVAEFDNGDVFHFWLQSGGEWAADTIYYRGDVRQPTVANGLLYKAERASPANPAWEAGVTHEIGDIVEPTVENGFYYTVTAVYGNSPSSGQVEPTWPTDEGATVDEDSTDLDESDGTEVDAADEVAVPDSSVVERYE